MLDIAGLTRAFNGIPVLLNLDLQVKSGKIIGIMGENGSGKSTLLKTIAGLQKPECGRGFLGDLELFTSNPAVRKKIVYWGHSPDFYGQFTALENLNLWLNLRHKKMTESLIFESLEKFGLPVTGDKQVCSFSAGMIQRLHLAKAELSEWSLGLYDEPLNALDETGTELLKESMKKFRDMGRSVIITSHYVDFIHSICDKVYRIENSTLNETDFQSNQSPLT